MQQHPLIIITMSIQNKICIYLVLAMLLSISGCVDKADVRTEKIL